MSRARATENYTRTQRRHLETVEEVKDIARERLAEAGAGGLSLRAIARDMGVVPSALYRYFPSHGHLLDALADDAATSMLDHVRAAIAAQPEQDYRARWLAALRAYRSWVLGHLPGYSLIFGELSAERAGALPPDAVVRQLVDLLGEIIAGANGAAVLNPRQTGVGRQLLAHAPSDREDDGRAETLVMVGTLSAWSAVHGTVALESMGRLPDLGISADDYFEAQLLETSRAVGFEMG